MITDQYYFQGSSLAQCASRRVQARLPPTIISNQSWVSPPPGWFYGNWPLTYSSQASYLPFINPQADLSPLFPQSLDAPGQINDLLSYQLGNSSTIQTVYAIDTPRRSTQKSLGPGWDYVHDYAPARGIPGFSNAWEFLAWGYDTWGVGYIVLYEAPVASAGISACFDILSRSDIGPSRDTLEGIHKALRGLGNADLTGLVGQIIPLVQNGARRGMDPVACDAACLNNTGLN